MPAMHQGGNRPNGMTNLLSFFGRIVGFVLYLYPPKVLHGMVWFGYGGRCG